MPRADHEFVLRQNGAVYGTGAVRRKYRPQNVASPNHSYVPQLTVVGMKHPDERVALQAVEFWSTVCEEEVELSIEAQEVSRIESYFPSHH